MAISKIFKLDETAPRVSPAGIASRHLINPDSCGADITAGMVTFPVGHSVGVHKHNCNEMVTVLEGNCEVEIEGVRTALKAFDTVHVEAGQWHRFCNAGTTPFTILWVYNDKDVIRTFRDAAESSH